MRMESGELRRAVDKFSVKKFNLVQQKIKDTTDRPNETVIIAGGHS